jgi:hypothetical protein
VLAYTFELFTNLDSLIARSKYIVVARIADPVADEGENGSVYKDGLASYEIISAHNVKGSLPLTRHPVILHSPFIRKYHNFRPGGMALLFLTDEYIIAGKKMLTNYANSGSVMPASPDLDVSKLKGLSEKKQVSLILKDYVRFKRRQLKELKADIERIQ